MQVISSILSPKTTPKKTLQGKVYEQGEVVRIHKDPPPKTKYITKWRNPFEEKGEVVDVLEKQVSEVRQGHKRTCNQTQHLPVPRHMLRDRVAGGFQMS